MHKPSSSSYPQPAPRPGIVHTVKDTIICPKNWTSLTLDPCGSCTRNHSKQQVVLILPLPHPSNLSIPLFLHCLSSDTTTQSSSLQSCPPLIQSLHCNPRGLSKIETLLSSGETIHFLTLPVRAHGHLLSWAHLLTLPLYPPPHNTHGHNLPNFNSAFGSLLKLSLLPCPPTPILVIPLMCSHSILTSIIMPFMLCKMACLLVCLPQETISFMKAKSACFIQSCTPGSKYKSYVSQHTTSAQLLLVRQRINEPLRVEEKLFWKS